MRKVPPEIRIDYLFGDGLLFIKRRKIRRYGFSSSIIEYLVVGGEEERRRGELLKYSVSSFRKFTITVGKQRGKARILATDDPLTDDNDDDDKASS